MSAPPILYAHALESVFAFLSLAELVSVLAVSHDWSAAVSSMRPIGATVVIRARNVPVASMCASGLARHIAALQTPEPPLLSTDLLRTVATRMRHLRSLHCRLSTKTVQVQRELVCPPTLTDLAITFPARASTSDVESVLAQIVSAVPLLQSLRLWLGRADLAVRFTSLQACPHLESFGFSWWNFMPAPSDNQLGDLRAMTHLTSVLMQTPNMALARRLLKQSDPPLRWQSICDQLPLTDEICVLLRQWPTLTCLRGPVHSEDLGFLESLPNLRELHVLNCAASSAELLRGLIACPSVGSITDLQLARCELDGSQMSVLLPRLQSLQRLTLVDASELESLRCLSTDDNLRHTLTALTLRACKNPQLRVSELSHVSALGSLTFLDLSLSFVDGGLDDAARISLTQPSRLLPNLTQFVNEAFTCSR